jgi:hypothetical protein
MSKRLINRSSINVLRLIGTATSLFGRDLKESELTKHQLPYEDKLDDPPQPAE